MPKDELLNLEIEINNSRLWKLDSKKNLSEITDEKIFLQKIIYDYYLKRYTSLSDESKSDLFLCIGESFKECIKYYKLEKGPFLNYFNKILWRKNRILKVKQKANEIRQGLTIGNNPDTLSKSEKLIIKVFQFYENNNLNSKTDHNIKLAAKALNCTEKDVVQALKACKETKAKFIDYKIDDNDGEYTSKELDNITYKNYSFDIIDRINTENNNNSIKQIDIEFNKCKDKAKTYISKIFTINIIKDKIKKVAKKYNLTEQKAVLLHKKEIDAEEILLFKLYIIDKKIVKEFIVNSHIPSQKEIAISSGVSEAAVTQGYKRFLEVVYNKIKTTKV